jgi:hypothetical protein
MTEDPRNANVRAALAVMTAWAAEPGGGDLVSRTAVDIAFERDDPEQGFRDLTIGLANLCGHLLVKREKDTGVPIDATLRELAIKYA